MRRFHLAIHLAAVIPEPVARAAVHEFMAGADYNRVEYNEPSRTSYGVSVRYRWLDLKPGNTGWFFQSDGYGHILATELAGGTMYRTDGTFFMEASAALGLGLLFGPFAQIGSGVGFRLTNRGHIALPVYLRYPGRAGIYVTPLIGWSF